MSFSNGNNATYQDYNRANFVLYDSNSKRINDIYQYDVDRVIRITPDEDIVPADAVYFHFSTVKTQKARVVKPTLSDNTYTAMIPNDLLAFSDVITIYIYVEGSVNGNITLGSISIPIIPRSMPEDYVYQGYTNELKCPSGLAVIGGEIQLIDTDGEPYGAGVKVGFGAEPERFSGRQRDPMTSGYFETFTFGGGTYNGDSQN